MKTKEIKSVIKETVVQWKRIKDIWALTLSRARKVGNSESAIKCGAVITAYDRCIGDAEKILENLK